VTVSVTDTDDEPVNECLGDRELVREMVIVPLDEPLDAPDVVYDPDVVALVVYVTVDDCVSVARPDCVLVPVIVIEAEAEPLEERQLESDGEVLTDDESLREEHDEAVELEKCDAVLHKVSDGEFDRVAV
jgi:hypothetical protein